MEIVYLKKIKCVYEVNRQSWSRSRNFVTVLQFVQ
jgi:hypothetical protein